MDHQNILNEMREHFRHEHLQLMLQYAAFEGEYRKLHHRMMALIDQHNDLEELKVKWLISHIKETLACSTAKPFTQ